MKKNYFTNEKNFQDAILPSAKAKMFFVLLVGETVYLKWGRVQGNSPHELLHSRVIVHRQILMKVGERAWFETDNIMRNLVLIYGWGRVK